MSSSPHRLQTETGPCPCGSGQTYVDCCQPFIVGDASPQTPEQLMRSRYTAYTQSAIGYIFKTMRGKALKKANRRLTERWAARTVWKTLDIVSVSDSDHGQGTVEFIARYEEKGQPGVHHEKSLFKQVKGVWYYVDSLPIKSSSASRQVIKSSIGRNDPCPCGSGKKYKRCYANSL